MPRSRKPTPLQSQPPMKEPLAFFLTWTTYGTWLPGDERGWTKRSEGFQPPHAVRQVSARSFMTEAPVILDRDERRLVERTIADHCAIRGWKLQAVNCRTNHVHVVVSGNAHPETIRDQLKAWCTRRLKERQHSQEDNGITVREGWWTEGGSQRHLNDDDGLEAAVRYTLEAQ